MKIGLFLTALALNWSLILTASVPKTKDCYANNTDPYLNFASKTSYFQADNEDDSSIEVEGCTARSFWILARHGTRNPGGDEINSFKERGTLLAEAIVANQESGFLCEADIKAIQEWKLDLGVEDEYLLTESGKQEHIQLGSRYKARLPGLFQGPFNEEAFQFRHTIKQRCKDSARGFAEGAFPGQEVFIPPGLEEDPLLRYYDFCPKWIEGVDENEATLEQQRLFMESTQAKDMLVRVNNRLGLAMQDSEPEPVEEENDDVELDTDSMTNDTSVVKNDNDNDTESDDLAKVVEKRDVKSADEQDQPITEISFEDATVMYDICRYEKAWYPDKLSAWCAVFDNDDLKVLEYYNDLEYWYTNGYAYTVNTQFACPLIRDMAEIFEGNWNGTHSTMTPNATMYFSHTGAVLPFLAMLGLYKDETPLLSDNFDDQITRKYRTSFIGPFTSNVAFVMFDCNGNSSKIMTLVEEKPVLIPGCDEEACDWDQFKSIYEDDIECNFDDICKSDGKSLSFTWNSGNSNSGSTVLSFAVLSAITLLFQ